MLSPKPTYYGDEQLAQAGSNSVSGQHSTTKVARSLLVFLRRYHAVDVGEVGHFCGGHHSIIHLFPSRLYAKRDLYIMYCMYTGLYLLFNHHALTSQVQHFLISMLVNKYHAYTVNDF